MGSFVGTPLLATGTDAALTLTFDKASLGTTLQLGDVLIVHLRTQPSNSGNDWSATGGSGTPTFTRIGPAFVGSQSDGRVTGAYWHTVTDLSAQPATYSFSRNFTDAGAPRRVGHMMVYRPDSGSTVEVAGFHNSYAGTTITNGKSAATFSVTGTVMSMVFAANENTSPNSYVPVTTPSGYTLLASGQTGTGTTGTRSSSHVWYAAQTGAVPAVSVTWAAASGQWLNSIAFREVVAPPSGFAVNVWNGTTETPGIAKLWNGTTEQDVTQILTLPWSGYTVAQMDADIAAGRKVYWAHRGGSANWSEMTMRAFTNAVWHGAKCLEISVHRSSDGVWIMSHDPDLTRVTATTFVIASTPSSSMLGLAVDAPTTGGVIGRLEDVLTAYPNFVLLVDNKPGSFFSEFLDLLETVPNSKDQIIVKLDGQYGTEANFQAAKARGFKTAGYWYPNNYATFLPPRAPYTDYIGMQYDATPTDWLAIGSYNKPIWGHVLQNSTQLNLCANAVLNTTTGTTGGTPTRTGTEIYQCANVVTLIPQRNVV